MKRPLNSDELGEKGEQRFAELCADAKLVCNMASRDRTGWDFIVEFPFSPATPRQPMDRRQQPPECRVQVKTVWEGQARVSLRLSSAERLAKALQPTCICVLCVDNFLDFKSIYAIHVINDVLADILREVRRCQSADSTRLNKTYIRFRYANCGTELALSGNDLRNVFMQMSGQDRVEYIRDKADQIERLGFIGSPYSGSLTVEAESDSELVDIMLGLKPGKLTAFSANETRFDISLPIYESQLGGMMQVSPRPMDGQLTIKDTATGEVVNIDVGVILPGPPGMFGADNLKARIVSKWLELVVTMGSNAGFSATVNCAVDEPITLSDLHFVNKVQRLISSEKGLMELRRQRKKVIVTEYSADSDPGLRSNFQFSRELLSTVDLIITKAGLPPASVRLTIEEINSQLGAIQFVHDLIAGPSSVKLNAFRIRTIDGYPQDLRRCEMLAIGRIMFTSHYIGFCAMGECTIDGVESIKTVTVDGLSLRELVILDTSEESFREFVGEMQAETGLSLVLRWEARPSISREQLTMPQERRKW